MQPTQARTDQPAARPLAQPVTPTGPQAPNPQPVRQPPAAQRQTAGVQPSQPAPRSQTQHPGAGPRVRTVGESEDYVHVQFRDPDLFELIWTPDWAAHAAQDVAPGAEVRTGKLRGSDEWQTESVLIPKPVDPQVAVQLAQRIVEKIGE
ncbi:MAG: hypothetical protein ABEJ31_15105 [Haloarculaceae archaeon]